MTQNTSTWIVAVALVCALEAVMLADVLVLRDGRRVEGMLVGIRGDVIQFEHRDGRTRQYDRSEIRSIQFENDDSYGGDRLTGSRPSAGLRERSVSVMARTQWTDTGIDVRPGQNIFFVATGEVRWGPGRRDGAAGERNSPFNQHRPMPDRPAASLIGRIGQYGDPFFIGNTTDAIRVRGAGRLFLGINDDVLEDNSGSLRVIISY